MQLAKGKFVLVGSHPSAPSHTPYETVAALMAAPMDKLADLFRYENARVSSEICSLTCLASYRSFPDEDTVSDKLTTGAPKVKL